MASSRPLLGGDVAPWGLRFRSSSTFITVVVCFAVFTVRRFCFHLSIEYCSLIPVQDTFLYSLVLDP